MKVLIVEGENPGRGTIEEVARELGYTVAGRVCDSASAVAMTRRLRPDVVLMDISLPDMDGIEVTRRIQAEFPTPVVIVYAHDRMDLVVSASHAGAGAFVIKPAQARELERAVAVALARFSDMTELARLNRELQAELAERRRAEEALRREHDFLEGLIDTAHVIVLVLDLEGRVVRFNRYMEEVSGFLLKEVQGKDWFEAFLPECEREGMRRYFFEAVEGGTLEGKMENRIVDREGREHLIAWYNKKLTDSDGGLIGVLSTGQDVTEREQMEVERERLQEQLYQSQKIESIGRLAGGIAHDFNNLLTPMIGYTEMALMDLTPADSLYADLQEIRDAAERARNLTGQLLAFSRRQVLAMKVVNLNEIVSSFEKMLGRIIGEDIEITTILEPALGKVKADPPQIQQVLMNLAVNARDAMPRGGRLQIETSNVYLDEAYAREQAGVEPGSYTMLAVGDTGTGMTQEVLGNIFEPFFTTKGPGKGTGLGLATVYGIVKQHGGSIRVYSEPNRGTTFKIYLPHTVEAPIAEEPIVEEAEVIQGRGTVLVVEDESIVRKLSCNVLQNHGYSVLEADSASKALRLAKEYPGRIDLLLTDVVMPQMNGRDLQEQVLKLRPDIKVLYMSGYTDEVIAHHGVLDPEVHFLQKPFSVERLVSTVRDMLQG